MPVFFAILTLLALLIGFDGAPTAKRLAISSVLIAALAACTVLLWLVQEGRL